MGSFILLTGILAEELHTSWFALGIWFEQNSLLEAVGSVAIHVLLGPYLHLFLPTGFVGIDSFFSKQLDMMCSCLGS